MLTENFLVYMTNRSKGWFNFTSVLSRSATHFHYCNFLNEKLVTVSFLCVPCVLFFNLTTLLKPVRSIL